VTTDFNEFITEPFTARQLAQLGVSGYPSSKFRMRDLLDKERVPRYLSQRRGGGYVYCFHDLSKKMQEDIVAHFHGLNQKEVKNRQKLSSKELDSILYASAPEYNRAKADKYLSLYNDYVHLKGNTLKAAIEKYNQEHPEQRTSYQRVKAVFKKYEAAGLVAFLGRYGKNLKNTTVPDVAFEQWRGLVLNEGAPSYEFCWKVTASLHSPTKESLASFPTCDAFLRRLRVTHTESQIFLSRYGQKKWSQKYAYYIDRDMSNIKAGQVWVVDHAQIDNMVKSHKSKAKREKVLASWYTGWMDVKTSKHLGGLLHEDSPNSDHILQAFYYAAMTYGLPEIVYFDNGKDMRAKDLTGGRKTKSVDKLDTEKARNTMAALGIKVIFALPYSPQSKTIERQFRKIKEWFSKFLPGYRGGNVLERPEKLTKEIKTGNIYDFEEYKPHFDRFITDVLNCMPSRGKALNGLSPNDLWNRENPIKKIADKDSLKL